mgnify:CR=1 FL=1
MSKKLLTNRDLLSSVAGIITIMSPSFKPRNLQVIIDHVDNYFQTNGKDKENYCSFGRLAMFYIEENDIYDFIEQCLKSCKEFTYLNLSQDEIDRGIGVDDENRPPFTIGGASDGTHLKEYYDFIDLDACVRNICNNLWLLFLDNDLYEQKCEIVYKKEKRTSQWLTLMPYTTQRKPSYTLLKKHQTLSYGKLYHTITVHTSPSSKPLTKTTALPLSKTS